MQSVLRSSALLILLRLAAAHAQPAEQITVIAPGQAASPTSTTLLSSSDIDRAGQSTIGALLDQIPAFGSQGINAAQNDGGFGEYFVDLRNLNFDRTLVLIDGNRFPLSGIQTDEAVDLNIIPAAFIEHVEVLKDGTQPQYAPDAVAGAVNLVLKDQIEGFQLSSYGAATGRPDGGTADLSLLGGHQFAGGHAAFGLDFYQRDPVPQSDRAWSADPIASAIATPGGNQILYGSTATPGGHAVGQGIDAVVLGGARIAPFNPGTDDDDPAGAQYLQGGLRRESAYFDADYALADSITANTELLFTDRRATTLQPPQTLGLTGTAKNPDGFTIPASDPYNPFAAPVTLERVVTEAGARSTTTSGPVWRVMAGLDGTRGSWSWSLDMDHGQSLSRYVTDHDINLTRALQTAGNGTCPAAQGCVLADWFGPDSLSPQALRYIAYTGMSQSAYAETVGRATASGPLFTAPAGPARLMLGLDSWTQSGATTLDPVTAQGNQSGPDAAATAGSYTSTDIYGTLKLPLLKSRELARRLDVSLAARFTATSRYGSFPTLRATMDYLPEEGIRLHAVTGTSRRPPAISEAFGGITGAPQPVSDPCDKSAGLRANPVVNANCLAQGLGPNFTQASPLIDVESGGNTQLRPEQSENEMLGLTLEPPRARWLSLSADYYQYRITHAIDSLADTDPDLIPDLCTESVHLSSPLCGLITRIAGGGTAGQISSILARDENIGTIKTNGLEFEARAHAPATGLGIVTFDWQTNWLLNYRLHSFGQPGFTQYAGTFPGLNDVGSYARVRARATFALERGPWSFGTTARFISGARVLGQSAPDLFTKAPDVIYQDIDITRHFGRLTAMAGIDNLADTRPPTLVDGQTNTDTSTYDVVGRVVWGRVTYAF